VLVKLRATLETWSNRVVPSLFQPWGVCGGGAGRKTEIIGCPKGVGGGEGPPPPFFNTNKGRKGGVPINLSSTAEKTFFCKKIRRRKQSLSLRPFSSLFLFKVRGGGVRRVKGRKTSLPRQNCQCPKTRLCPFNLNQGVSKVTGGEKIRHWRSKKPETRIKAVGV